MQPGSCPVLNLGFETSLYSSSVAVGAHPEPEPYPVLAPPSTRYINRELSRLDFDERVLAMAEDPKLPLLERVRFLAIFSQQIFMIA